MTAMMTKDGGTGTGMSIDESEALLLADLITRYRANTVLEFGPGDSTQVFLAAGCKVTAVEYDLYWLGVTHSRFPNVELISYDWPEVSEVEEALAGRQFDLAFVDSPSSDVVADPYHLFRLPTIQLALKLAKVVVLHDASRDSIKESVIACGVKLYNSDGGTEYHSTKNGILVIDQRGTEQL